MEKNTEKGEFLSKVEAFAKEVSELTGVKEGVKRGFVILASENVDGEEETKQIIAVGGNGKEIAKAIAEFAVRDETKNLVSHGLKLGALKTLSEKFGGGII